MRLALAILVLALLALPAAAGEAAVRFGADLKEGTPTLSLGANTTGTNTASTSGPPVRAPISGVITTIRLLHGATDEAPGFVGFRLLSGTSPSFTARHATYNLQRLDFPLMPNVADGAVIHTPTNDLGRRIGIPVAAGEHLGVYQNVPSGGTAPIGMNDATSAIRATAADHVAGPRTYTAGVAAKLFVDATIEPDADGDQFGDETQDNCPQIANNQSSNPCPKEVVVQREEVRVPGPTVTVAGPTVTVPGPAPAPIVVPGPVTTIAAPLCTVPRLRGLSLAGAKRRLRAARCSAGRVSGKRSGRARVRTQTIPAGTRVEQGTRVGVALRAPGRAVRRRR